MRGIEPRASRMQSERSTIWATSPLRQFLFMTLYVSTSVSITPSGQQVAAALAHSITRRAYHPFGPIESIVSRLTHGLDGPIRHLFLSLETKSPSFFFWLIELRLFLCCNFQLQLYFKWITAFWKPHDNFLKRLSNCIHSSIVLDTLSTAFKNH